MEDKSGSLPLAEYEEEIKQTDKFKENDLTPILLGLFGEIGSVMSATKKYRREQKAYIGYKDAVEEELGDALWYFTAVCRRLDLSITKVFLEACCENDIKTIAASDSDKAPISHIISLKNVDTSDNNLIALGAATAVLLKIEPESNDQQLKMLVKFARAYIEAIHSVDLSFARIARNNLRKAMGRFKTPERNLLPDFDKNFPSEEQLPRNFEIEITQRKSGQSYLRWNNVFLGSPLTDNILNPDGYRFHDVFHLAYAAILHWSPTFRALIKHKRKSDPIFDEAQDSGRAIVVEEGLTAWLYSYSKGLNYFEDHTSISFDVLKTIQKFVSGYEVEACPLKLWEDAILQGYEVFRQVQRNNGGIIIGDRGLRKLTYQPIGVSNEN